eukprot:GHRR01008899.1.p2 GENE.GHRR01008899.1~~GHRR01008899.1.p2  ORF type:complete len:383 (+),score=156.14 GHRR01008899.1:3565-4713(+)
MEGKDMDRLKLPLMVNSAENDESMYTAFTVTVDLRKGTSTGISAADRAATLRAMADFRSSPADFRRPGHIFPLRYRPGGVIVRPGHTEAALDLAKASGSYPAGVLCEIVDRRDGSVARTPQLMEFAKQHGLKIVTIADLIRYRLRHEQLLQQVAAVPLETRHGLFTAHCFRSVIDGTEHVALVAGDVGTANGQANSVLTHLQMQQHLTDVFGALHCGQGPFLDQAMSAIAAAGAGVVLYVQGQQSTGPGRGLAAELQAFACSQEACSTSGRTDADSNTSSSNRAGPSSSLTQDLRDAAVAAHMLRYLGVSSVQLTTNSQATAQQLRCCGVGASVTCSPLGSSNSSSDWQKLQALLNASGSGNSTITSSSNGTSVAAPAGAVV